MFAVKGWSVDPSSLKPQTEIFNSTKSQDGAHKKSIKKRKRGHSKEAKQDPNPRPDDVGRLWEQHVEGGEASKKERKRERKKQNLDRKREEKKAAHEMPNAVSKPKAGPKIERWEDIVLGTRGEKMGHSRTKKKHKQMGRKDAPADVESSEASEDSEPEVNSGIQREQSAAVLKTPQVSQSTNLTPMQSAMRQKLVSARFRHLNQTLYTEPSSKAKEIFDQNPEIFEDYHTGFRQQVSVWPQNPLDKFIIAIRQRGKIKPPPQFTPYRRKANSKLIRPPKDTGVALLRTNGTSVIADLGCGDARLAQTLTVSGDTTVLNLKVLSYDLHASSNYVTTADISNLPLKDDSVDVAILCLALMGTNWISFVEEAHRILHWKGELWVAEIKSRFGRVSKSGRPVDHSVGGKRKPPASTKATEAKAREQEELDEHEVLQTEVDGVPPSTEETDVSAFVQVLKRRGFILKPPSEKSVDLRNKMFVKMEFIKALTPIKGKGKAEADSRGGSNRKLKFFSDGEEDVDTDEETKVLKPCLYKVR